VTCDGKTMIVNKSEIDPIDSRLGNYNKVVPLWWLCFESNSDLEFYWKTFSGAFKGQHLS
jgi:hypothetical protein